VLQAAQGVPDEPNHGYTFQGTCQAWLQLIRDGEVEEQYGFTTLWAEAKASWDGKTNTLTERIKLTNPEGGPYGGEVETVLKCAQDPLLFPPNCVLVAHKNTTGWDAFSDAAVSQKRPILAGKTTLGQATELSQKKGAAPPPPQPKTPPAAANAGGAPAPHKAMTKPQAQAASGGRAEAGPERGIAGAPAVRVPVPTAPGSREAPGPAASGAAAAQGGVLAAVEAGAQPWVYCLGQLPQTGLAREACDVRFEAFLKAVPAGNLAAAQRAFEVVRDATAQQSDPDRKYWAAKLRAGLVPVPEALTAYLAQLGEGAPAAPPGRAAPVSPAVAKAAAAVLQAKLLNVEGEDLAKAGRILVGGGKVAAQPMAGFGAGWSGDGQLFWSGGAVGAVLDLLVDVPAAATYAVEIYLTRAPDYGQVKLQVEGQEVAFTVDGYAPRVLAPTPRQLGKFSLAAGERKLSLMIVGKNPQATGYLVGIDRLRLYPAGPP
jgi:hypothetical protein